MKWFVLLLVPTVAVASCREGYVPTDVQGVCQASVSKTNPDWIVDEQPPSDKMPSWQREGVTVINAPNLEIEDRKMDQEKIDAEAEGKRRAGIK